MKQRHNIEETTNHLFDILFGYYIREIGLLLESMTDKENPDYGWFIQPLSHEILGNWYEFVGFSFQPKPKEPVALFLKRNRIIKLKRRQRVSKEQLDRLPLDTLRALQKHLQVRKNLTNDPTYKNRFIF